MGWYLLDVEPGWHFRLRVYRPGRSVLDGSFLLPAAKPVREGQSSRA